MEEVNVDIQVTNYTSAVFQKYLHSEFSLNA